MLVMLCTVCSRAVDLDTTNSVKAGHTREPIDANASFSDSINSSCFKKWRFSHRSLLHLHNSTSPSTLSDAEPTEST